MTISGSTGQDTAGQDANDRGALLAVVRWLTAAQHLVGGLLLAAILALVLIQVAQRFLPGGGWAWTGELARFSLVWLTFAVAGALIGRDGHVALQLVDQVVSGRALHAVQTFAGLVVAAVSVAFATEAYDLMQGPSRQSSPVMGIPLTWMYAVPLIGFALAALHAVVGAGLTALRAAHGERSGEPDAPSTSNFDDATDAPDPADRDAPSGRSGP